MAKLYAQGNFFHYINDSDLVFTDKLENVLISKSTIAATDYSIKMNGIGVFVNNIEFSDIYDESGTAYASQSDFETYIYQNTGERISSSGGSSATNLGYTASAINGIVTSDTGTDATIPLSDGTNAGLLKPADYTKIQGIANGATANDTDANLKNRANHTGTQTASTISDLTTRINTDAPAETTTTIGTLINGASAKTTPVDADMVGLMDSASSNILKKLSWSNIKATLKTYFDTLYAPLSSSSIVPAYTPHETFRGVTYANNSTTETTYGGITISTTGSATARAVSTTNYATKQIRKGFVASVVSSGRYTETRGSALLWYISGGFRFICDVYISDTAFSSGCRQFYGMMGQTTSLTYSDTVSVDSMLNIVGFGSDASDTNLQVIYNDGAGTASKIDLGSSFPANRSSGAALTAMYSLELYNGYDSNIIYKAINNETGVSVEGTISTNLPATTQGLNFVASRCMGGGGGITNSGQFDLGMLGVYSI